MNGVSVGSLDSREEEGRGSGSSHESRRAFASTSVCEFSTLPIVLAGASAALCDEWNESVVCHSLLLDRLAVPLALVCPSPLEEDALAIFFFFSIYLYCGNAICKRVQVHTMVLYPIRS